MTLEQPREEAGSRESGASDQLPPLVGVARFRRIMAAVAAFVVAPVLLMLVTLVIPHGMEPPFGFWAVAILAVVPVWLPSLLLARGLSRRKRWAIHAALVHDALTLLACECVLVWMLQADPGRLFDLAGVFPYTSAVALLLGVPFAAEAGYLLRAVWRWRPAWALSGIGALAVLVPGVAGPPIIREHRARHVEPLVAYAREHWSSLPSGYRVTVSRSDAHGRSCDHRDLVEVDAKGSKVTWSIWADHRSDGRWEFQPRHHTGAGPAEWLLAECDAMPGAVLPAVESGDDARELLARVGVADPDLGSAQIARWDGGDCYEFWSPRAQGLYRVSTGPRPYVQLCRKRPLLVP